MFIKVHKCEVEQVDEVRVVANDEMICVSGIDSHCLQFVILTARLSFLVIITIMFKVDRLAIRLVLLKNFLLRRNKRFALTIIRGGSSLLILDGLP